jgi:hypothetical protein
MEILTGTLIVELSATGNDTGVAGPWGAGTLNVVQPGKNKINKSRIAGEPISGLFFVYISLPITL